MKDNFNSPLYSDKYVDFTKEKAFFGLSRNTQRYDDMKYEWYDKSNNKQQGHDWPWDEITIKNDIVDHSTKLTESEQFVLRRYLQRAIFLDSINGRGPVLTFGQVATSPEIEAVITTWQQFEVNKHSRTYTKHLRAFYVDPKAVFDESFEVPELQKSAKAISDPYNKAYYYVIEWVYKTQLNIPMSADELKTIYSAFIMAWIEVNILEGIRFYPFFASVWAMNNGRKLMNELTGDLIFICRDENEHLNLTQHTLKLFKRVKEEGFSELFLELMPDIKERYYESYIEECEWVDYVFSKGSYLGMSANIMKDYINYLTIRRMKAIGLDVDVDRLGGKLVTKNPIPWVNDYIWNDEEEKLPQQENVLNYVTNGIDDDLNEPGVLDDILKLIKVRS